MLIWTAGIFISCLNIENPLLVILTNQFYSITCHQNPAKTFLCDSNLLFVCARCFGIYTGALLMSFVLLFYKKTFRLNLLPLIIASVPMLIDVLGVLFNFYNYSLLLALLTGILFGSTSFIYILSVIENSFSEYFKR
ncbi:MAG: DUF2085 domain-containing protein [Ignavibacteriaceae bacterium]|nr:DUF2085 domain-containing protein [Ignavibacteriaceae bacterium]